MCLYSNLQTTHTEQIEWEESGHPQVPDCGVALSDTDIPRSGQQMELPRVTTLTD